MYVVDNQNASGNILLGMPLYSGETYEGYRCLAIIWNKLSTAVDENIKLT